MNRLEAAERLADLHSKKKVLEAEHLILYQAGHKKRYAYDDAISAIISEIEKIESDY